MPLGLALTIKVIWKSVITFISIASYFQEIIFGKWQVLKLLRSDNITSLQGHDQGQMPWMQNNYKNHELDSHLKDMLLWFSCVQVQNRDYLESPPSCVYKSSHHPRLCVAKLKSTRRSLREAHNSPRRNTI